MTATMIDRYVIGRERNVVRVDFSREPEPPTPPFPGAGAMRACAWQSRQVNAAAAGLRLEAS